MVFAGLMPVAALGMDVVINAVAPQRTGAASAISETTQELGFALGIALLGSLGTAIYRRQMNDAIPPDIPAQAADTARDTLGGATGVADQLPAGLLVTAGQAYTDGLQAAAAASAVALTAAAAVAVAVLRRTPTRSGQEPLTAAPDDGGAAPDRGARSPTIDGLPTTGAALETVPPRTAASRADPI
jgi:DHA2 family multidrug resistance protein-like MFS transporter